ncbi:MAG TPA: hypothetical protein VHA79_14000 [Mycobacteriales bacterium]|nr:hypothetical protein [Mycobacteriales bacterium]
MSVKRALSVLALAIAAGGVGSAVIVGTSAAGAPRAALPEQSLNVAPPGTVAPHMQTAPKTTLHLPSNLRLISRTTGAKALDRSHTVFSAALSKPGHRKIIGTTAYICVSDTSNGLHQDCRGALALRNGVILVDQTLDVRSARITGTVTGGNGYYEGAQGTVSGRDLGGGKERLTIDYAFK